MLPTLSTPIFTTKIPSTGKEIRYRPFLVKEEKILLMALEGRDPKEIKIAITETLRACIQDDVDVSKLATFDVEYLFLMLRAKSVGEVIEFKVGHGDHSECKYKTDVSIDLNNVFVEGTIKGGNIDLGNGVGIKLHYPTASIFESEAVGADDILSIIAECVDYVYDSDNVYDDFTKPEMIEWLGNLSKDQYEEINEFFANVPKLKHTVKWTCEKCGEDDEMTIEGLHNFFM